MTAESKTYGLFYITLEHPGGYSAQAIKGCIDYELKSADNPYVLTNFCKLLSLTYILREDVIFALWYRNNADLKVN